MAEKNATKKSHVDVGGQAVPADMVAHPGALAVRDEAMIAEIKQLSNTTESGRKEFPMLKLQHTTTPDGEPNPLRGHFSLITKNDLGEWETKDLGESVKVQFLLQHYFLKMTKGDDVYSSGEFDNDFDVIALWKRGPDKSELFAEGTPFELQKRFLKKDDKNRVRSELVKLSKLYLLVDGELVVWKTSFTGTIAWSKYTKLISFPAGVITRIGRTEEKKGSVKYYAPVFKAEERITDLTSVRDNIQVLKDMLPKKNQVSDIQIDDNEPPFPVK